MKATKLLSCKGPWLLSVLGKNRRKRPNYVVMLSNEIPDRNSMCFAMLCCSLDFCTCFSPFAFGFLASQSWQDLRTTSVRPPPPVSFRWIASLSPVPPRATYPGAYTAATTLVQINSLSIVCMSNIPICHVCSICLKSEKQTDALGWGGGRG